MRPETPESVKIWKAWEDAGPPRCCHTCDFYDLDGNCARVDVPVPEGFDALDRACDQWMREAPF